jgi:hypothetical protein
MAISFYFSAFANFFELFSDVSTLYLAGIEHLLLDVFIYSTSVEI